MIDYFLQVGDYLEDRLTDSAKEAFETEMSSNEELKQAVANHDIIDVAIDMLWEDDARQVAEKAHQAVRQHDDFSQERDPKVFSIGKMAAVAASVLVLVVSGYFLMGDMTPVSSKLYAEFYSPYQGVQTRGDNTITDLALCEQGHILMEKEQFSKAIEVFKESISNKEECHEKSEWYLVLAQLHQKNAEDRDSLLKEIVSKPGHKYISYAKKLTKHL